MEYIIGILVALLGGVIYFKKKASDAAVDAKLARTKGKDEELEVTAEELARQIVEIDKNIEKARKERKERTKAERRMTLKERRDRIRKGIKK